MPYVCIGCDELKRLVQVKSTFGTSEIELHVEVTRGQTSRVLSGTFKLKNRSYVPHFNTLFLIEIFVVQMYT